MPEVFPNYYLVTNSWIIQRSAPVLSEQCSRLVNVTIHFDIAKHSFLIKIYSIQEN